MSQNQKQLSVFNANGAVKSCLKKVAIDLGIKVQFEE